MPPVRTSKKNSLLENNAQQLSIKSFFTRGVAKDASTSIINPPDNSVEASPAAVEALADPNTPPPVKKVVNAFQALRPDSKGEKEVYFHSDAEWEKSWQAKLSARTKKLSFGSSFVLTDRHIEQLISLGPGICRSLTHFEFSYRDVSYGAHNANKLTPDTTVRLACMCPGLRNASLQGFHRVQCDAIFIAFLSNCPNITYLELSGPAHGNITQASFDALLAHANWAPKLKTLCIPPSGLYGKQEKNWMKAMRAVSKEREMLVIKVIMVEEEKKWGDWELTTWATRYSKGKEVRGW